MLFNFHPKNYKGVCYQKSQTILRIVLNTEKNNLKNSKAVKIYYFRNLHFEGSGISNITA